MNLFDTEKLIHLLNEGNHLAFERIYQTYSNGLWDLALQYLKSPMLADDALQYVFMRLWENRQFVNPKQNIRNFLFTILKNYLINVLKSKENEVERYILATREAMEEAKSSAREKIELEQRIAMIYRFITQLPTQKKRICELKLAGYSNENIADEMNVSVNTVKSQYHTALGMLRDMATLHKE